MWILSALLITMLILAYPRWQQKIAIKRWRKFLDLDKHQTAHQQLFATIDGFSLSKQARMEHDAMEYTYGEIDFTSFIAQLSLTKPDNKAIFYDLGSGTGKAVFACAMVFNVQKSCGIELFSLLHKAAIKQQRCLQQRPDYQEKIKSIQLINDDFLHADFSDATHVFINAAALFGETWIALNQRLEKLEPGTIIITTSKKLSSDIFILKKATLVQMSWGLVMTYIQQRKSALNLEIVLDNIK